MLPEREPTLRGQGLVLRRPTHDDAALVRAAGTDAYITSVTTVPPAPATDAEVVAYIARQHSRLRSGQGVQLVIEDESSGGAVGQIGLMVKDAHRAAIGYWVDPGARRRGYAGRAVRVLSDWALDLPGLHRREASVEPWNDASMRAVGGAGFVREGVAANWEMVSGQPRDMVIYARVPGVRGDLGTRG
ncbi:N-acetyltransferase [Galactobacter valiniphilus]|uniref:N-acetyltransferase n=1 Tax=Galactobacter valiniphilus TaxID=2676122 RepID=A0A399J7D0_9MICC|nr:GNAT family N-acetyltransferase [Galactobacter valiniphilus]RII41425.1 N-acetyltransferase [Galactobacter valiniphilus]